MKLVAVQTEAETCKSSRRDEDPRERILLAAQKIFLEQGYELATVREITLLAEVNIAAVNYYFGSKDELLRSALDRLMLSHTTARLQALAECEANAAPGSPSVAGIVEALVRPMIRLSRDQGGGRPLIRLLQQIRARPSEGSKNFFSERFDPTILRFVRALKDCLPDVSVEDVFWRYNFTIGAVMQVLIDADPETLRLKQLSGGLCDTDDDEEIIAQLVAFASSAFMAPPARRKQACSTSAVERKDAF